MTRTRRWAWSGLGFILLSGVACGKPATTGDAIPFDKVARPLDRYGDPAVCADKASKRTLRRGRGSPDCPRARARCSAEYDDCYVAMYERNNPDGTPWQPVGDKAYRGFVELSVEKRDGSGGSWTNPSSTRSRSRSKVSGETDTTKSGTVTEGSLALRLSNGEVVSSGVKIRAFVQVHDLNGTCAVRYVGGERIVK